MGGRGQAPGHEGDHGPQDHGFVAGGQVLIIAGGAPVLLIQAKVRSTTQRRGSNSKVCGLCLVTTCRAIFSAVAQVARVPVYPAPAQTRRTRRQARWVFHSSGRAATRS
jgi:hypothetical protein